MSKRIVEKSVTLTERENEVLLLMVQGYSNQEIAKRLIISESTTKAHMGSLFRKFSVANRVELAVLAVKNKIVDI